MIVTCEDCGASFNFNESLIKPTGSKVRCSKCKKVFTVLPPTTAPIEDQTAAEVTRREAPPPEQAADAQDTALADLDSKLDDIFGDEGNEIEMADIGEMTDLDLESAELSADLIDGGTEDAVAVDQDSGVDDLLAELEADGLELPYSDDRQQFDLADGEVEVPVQAGDDHLPGADVLSLDDGEAELDDDELPELDALLDLSGEDFDLDTENLKELEAQLTTDDEDADDEVEDALELEDMEGPLELAADDMDLDVDLELADEAGGGDAAEALDLEAGAAETSAAAVDSAAADLDIDELDLSDIEDMLDDDEVEMGVQAALTSDDNADAEAVEEFDLSDFARELAVEDAQTDPAEVDGDDIELDLDLDMGDEIIPDVAAPADEAAKDELDFTDLADMLEPEEAPASAAEVAADELDLELDLSDLDVAPDAAEPGDEDLDLDSMLDEADGAGPEEELELSLELDGLSDDAATSVDSQPELEFDLEADLGEPDTGFPQEDELELNLLDDDEPVFGEAGATTQAIATDAGNAASGGLATGAQEIGATTDDFATEEFTDARDLTGDSDFLIGEDTAMPLPSAKPRRSRKPLVAVLVGLVLIIAALIIPNRLGVYIPYLSDIRIPYLSDWLGGDVKKDAGNLKIIPLDRTISAKFVDNQSAGKLLVVSGQVRNEYEHPRSFIQIAGKLFKKDGTPAKSATVYAGNMISTLDLARLDFAKIKTQLQNQSGQRKSNFNVKRGRVVPFMIVFDQLPDGLDEYSIEVVGSARKK